MKAVRNVTRCTKDCLCLYVCPTGASDMETGQIDRDRCIGCGMCYRCCPNHAISFIPDTFPVQQPKTQKVVDPLYVLVRDRAKGELMAKYLQESEDPRDRQFAKALEKSFRRQGEDLIREAGYLLPQSRNVRMMLMALLNNEADPKLPREEIMKLLDRLQKQQR